MQQFNKLPKELREKVSSPAAMDVLSSLESKYQVNLAMLVMQIMVKQVLMKDLTAYLITEMSLSSEQAQSLNQELQEKILFSVATYLGLKIAPPLSPEDKELEQLMKDNAIILPSSDLMSRCRQIILTYRKGVRTKMDTRAALERNINQGGLGLDAVTAERLLRALDLPVKPQLPVAEMPKASAELSNLIDQQEGAAYNLKSAIASGQIKTPPALVNKFKQTVLDTKHEIEATEDELEIAAPKPRLLLQEEKDNTPEKTVKPNDDVKTQLESEKDLKSINPEAQTEVKILEPSIPSVPITPIVTHDSEPARPLSSGIDSETDEDRAAKFAVATNAKLKTESIEALKPVAATNTNFKKEPSELSGLWAKLFKEKASVAMAAKNKANSLSSNHLEEAVREAVQASTQSSRPAASSDSRTRIEDVKFRPKVMGPLEELRYLDLVNFRRLGATPKDITTKIVNKIHLLEKDGYDRMVEGVKAWRQSPVNRLYIRLAQEAVVSGLTLKEAVAKRQADQKESLSMAELEAIVAMNNQLMF
ncbi:MAG: hypothetical protein PHE20_00390 [Patescibacteria group bacterium]|nr:hypothetical protein [Patescibacteria group bacterium]